MKKILLIFVSVNLALATASVDRMIGQMIMLGFDGSEIKEPSLNKLFTDISYGKVGGVLLMGRNIKSPKQLKSLTTRLNEIPVSLPLLVAIDEEGGEVLRLDVKKGFKYFPSAQEVAARASIDEAALIYKDMAKYIKKHGVNLNLAPVVDLTYKNSPIAKKNRAFSANEDEVSIYANVFIDEFNKQGILTSAKHFPGHGSSIMDSHNEYTDISRTWKKAELKPYYNLIKTNRAKIIMLGHLYLKQFDNKYPASISEKIANGILRQELGYDGVVITDDLLMKGISDKFSLKEIIINAIKAKVNIFLISDYRISGKNVPDLIYNIIKEALNNNEISVDELKQSYVRIKKLKESLK